MYKICLSLAFSPQTEAWGENTWQTKLLHRSPFGPKFVNHHDALNSFHLESIPNLQGVKTRLRWRTTLWGSKSETARVPAGAKWGAKGGFGFGHPPEGLAPSPWLRFFCLVGISPQKNPSHQAKRSESLQLFFFGGGRAFWSIQMPISACFCQSCTPIE